MTGAQEKELLGRPKAARELSDTEAQRYEAYEARTLKRLDLEDRITRQQAEVNAGTAHLVELLDEHLAEGFWEDHDGLTSPVAFLTWKLGQTPSEGAHLLNVATRLEERPLIKESFAKGELSFPQVKILVGIAEPATEAELVAPGPQPLWGTARPLRGSLPERAPGAAGHRPQGEIPLYET